MLHDMDNSIMPKNVSMFMEANQHSTWSIHDVYDLSFHLMFKCKPNNG